MDKTIKVLQFGTHDEECGIAKYQQQFIESMKHEPDLFTEYFRHSPNQTKRMLPAEFSQTLAELREKLKEFDILHVQHEISFFHHYELEQIIKMAKSMGKKVMVTIHTDPDVRYSRPHLGGFSPRSIMHFARSIVSSRRYLRRYVNPLNMANLILVHNKVTKKHLASHGITESKIHIIKIPVPTLSFEGLSDEIKSNLGYQKGDVIFCTVGFLSRAKGILQAVKALTYLPSNYKLAIIGGNHPNSDDPSFYDEVCDLINNLEFQDRVYITGYIEDDQHLNALIRECDICAYPFDNSYYQYVSSASLNNAFANHKPVVAYKTTPFIELNDESGVLNFCASPNYYELARTLRTLDIKAAAALSQQYAQRHAYDKEAAKFINIYRQLI